MAGKPKPMSQIKQLIILNRQGKGTKTIARLLGMSKNTVKAYLFKLDKLLAGTVTAGITAEKLLSLGEPEVYALFHPGNPSYKDSRYDAFKADLEHYRNELERKGVTGLAAALAKGEGKERVYIVEPTGNYENDPNLTDKKFPGNPTRSYRSEAPLKIIGEVTEWLRQTPDEIQKFREKVENNKGQIIN